MLITWAASVIAAYMAGEHSLVPKAIEYVQSHFRNETKTAAKDVSEERSKETEPANATTE